MSVTETIERDEWLLLLGMVADLRAELEGIHNLLKDESEDDGEEEEEDS